MESFSKISHNIPAGIIEAHISAEAISVVLLRSSILSQRFACAVSTTAALLFLSNLAVLNPFVLRRVWAEAQIAPDISPGA